MSNGLEQSINCDINKNLLKDNFKEASITKNPFNLSDVAWGNQHVWMSNENLISSVQTQKGKTI